MADFHNLQGKLEPLTEMLVHTIQLVEPIIIQIQRTQIKISMMPEK